MSEQPKGPAEGFFCGFQFIPVMLECQKRGWNVFIGSEGNAAVPGPKTAPATGTNTAVLGIDYEGKVHSFALYEPGDRIRKMGW